MSKIYRTLLLTNLITTSENPQTLKDNIRGYESVIGFIILRYVSQMYDFFTDTINSIPATRQAANQLLDSFLENSRVANNAVLYLYN